MATLILGQETRPAPGALARDGDLWIPIESLESSTGWCLKSEGACYGEFCVPLPEGGRHVEAGRFSLTALWRLLERPFAADRSGETWVFGEGAAARRSALASLEAPDFRLPDSLGRMHSLSEYRGQKVFLPFWSSW